MAEKPVGSLLRLIVIGGSAGSLNVVLQLLSHWQQAPLTAIVLVLHRRATSESQLTEVLRTKSNWPLEEAKDKAPILPGNIYIAPADYHLLIETNHTFSLDYSEKINYSRPSIDATFETAAIAYHRHLVCILLSGANADGTDGLKIARKHGAHIIIQLPATATAPFMPEHAIKSLTPDAILDPQELIPYLNSYLDTSF